MPHLALQSIGAVEVRLPMDRSRQAFPNDGHHEMRGKESIV